MTLQNPLGKQSGIIWSRSRCSQPMTNPATDSSREYLQETLVRVMFSWQFSSVAYRLPACLNDCSEKQPKFLSVVEWINCGIAMPCKTTQQWKWKDYTTRLERRRERSKLTLSRREGRVRETEQAGDPGLVRERDSKFWWVWTLSC